MKLVQLSTLLVTATLAPLAYARSLSYRMRVGEPKACFYAYVSPDVNLSTALLQFYYSASAARGTENVYVDAEVTDQNGRELYKQMKQTHAEVNIKPSIAGEYALCISHHGNPTEKNLDIDVTLPHAPSATPSEHKEQSAKLENTITKLQRELSDLVHTLKYIKNRERRNLETVESIDNWIAGISVFELLLIVGMSILQVVVLRTFFSNKAYQRV